MLVVYTVSIGSKYELQPVPASGRNVRFVCITDQEYAESECGWEIRKAHPDIICGDPHRSSRYYKILANKVFPGFDKSIYVDTSVRLTRDPEYIWNILVPSESCIFGGFYHSFRDRIIDEFMEVERRRLDYKFSLARQYSAFKRFAPEALNAKPVFGGFFARRHNSAQCVDVMERWFNHVLSYSRRDQLSLPYCLSYAPASSVNLLSQDILKSDFHELFWSRPTKPEGYVVDDFEVKLSNAILLEEEAKSAMQRGVIERGGKKFAFTHSRMQDGIRSALIRGDYEQPESELIEKFIDPSDKVLELGICIGYTSMKLYSIVGDRLSLFEADPLNSELAQLNMDLNNIPVKVNNYALLPDAINKGIVTFYSSPNPSSSSVYKGSDKDVEISAKSLSFEAIIKVLGITALVVDIEGGEVDLMIHCSDWSQVCTVIMKTHERIVGDARMQQAFESMLRNGFKLIHGGQGLLGFAVFERNLKAPQKIQTESSETVN